MRDKPQKRKLSSSRRTSASSRSDEDDDDTPPTTRTPAPSPYSYPNYENEDDEEEEEEEEEEDDDANLLEILIETLTGTTFQVRVSPWETGAGLKALLQRTQGLPASHQHILIGTTELTDDAPLIDQGIQDGSTLRLVLAMKGGPINSRRIPTYDDSLWKEFSDYMEVNREELWENEPGRPVTLLVLREGDAVNLYRVVENDDGTFSPLNESWSSNRSGSSKTDRSEKDSLLEETLKHQQKMADLSSRMEALKLKNNERKKKKKPNSKPGSPRVKVLSASRLRKSRNSGTSKTKKESVNTANSSSTKIRGAKTAGKVTERTLISPMTPDQSMKPIERPLKNTVRSRLPPVLPTGRYYTNRSYSRPSTQETSSDLRRLSISRGSRILDELPIKTQPRHVEFSHHPKLDSIRQRERFVSLQTLKEDTKSPKPSSTNKERKDKEENKVMMEEELKENEVNKEEEEKNFSRYNSIEEKKGIQESREAWSGRDVPFPLYIDPGSSRRKNRYKNRLNQSYNVDSHHLNRDFDDRPKTSPEILERRTSSAATSSTMSDRIQLRAPDDKLKELISILNTSRSNSRLSDVSSFNSGPFRQNNAQITSKLRNYSRNPHQSGRTSLSTSFTSLRGATSPSPPFTPRGAGSLLNSKSQEQLELLKDLVKNQLPISRRSTPEKGQKVVRRPGSGQFKATVTPRGPPGISPRTPKRKPKKIHPRCQQCKKKIGVVTSYPCRCGLVFCSQHRYAETHDCTFDYKSAGKKLIEIANPLVVPPKLPKI